MVISFSYVFNALKPGGPREILHSRGGFAAISQGGLLLFSLMRKVNKRISHRDAYGIKNNN